MKVGFTGTRTGLTAEQRHVLRGVLKDATEVHHGDCVGGDAEFHKLAREAGVRIVLHPPKDSRQRAFCEDADEERPALPYLIRNKRIVGECDLLVACPKEDHEPTVMRGQGTWSTIRFARRLGRPLRVVWP